MTNGAILELKELDVFYGPIHALKKVSLHINEGETVSLIGSNGAGKSTLLMSIFGQPRAADGQILYQGVDITHNFMGFFTEFDHHAVGRDIDVATWDSYPLGFLEQFWFSSDEKAAYLRQGHPDIAAFHHDLYRGCSSKESGSRWGVMEQQPGPVNWARFNPAPLPGMVAHPFFMTRSPLFQDEVVLMAAIRSASCGSSPRPAAAHGGCRPRCARGIANCEAIGRGSSRFRSPVTSRTRRAGRAPRKSFRCSPRSPA